MRKKLHSCFVPSDSFWSVENSRNDTKVDFKPNDPLSLSKIGDLFYRTGDYKTASVIDIWFLFILFMIGLLIRWVIIRLLLIWLVMIRFLIENALIFLFFRKLLVDHLVRLGLIHLWIRLFWDQLFINTTAVSVLNDLVIFLFWLLFLDYLKLALLSAGTYFIVFYVGNLRKKDVSCLKLLYQVHHHVKTYSLESFVNCCCCFLFFLFL